MGAMYAPIYESIGLKYGLDPDILHSVAIVESAEKPNATGDGGKASGLMQVHFDTWKAYEKKYFPFSDLKDPAKNIEAGALILRDKIKIHHGDKLRGLIAYNGHGGRFTFSGIMYLAKILGNYAMLTGKKIPVPFPSEEPMIYAGLAFFIFFQINNTNK